MFKLVIIIITIANSKQSPCVSTACSGPYKLKAPTPMIPHIRHNTRTLTVLEIKPVKVTIAYRERYTAYCYSGSALDPNTGCDKAHRDYLPTKEEIMIWAHKKQCSYGVECSPGGSCWGSDSNRCILRPNLSENWAVSKEFEGNNEIYMTFPHHACVSTWRCGVKSFESPTNQVYTDKGIKVTVSVPHQSAVKLDFDSDFYNISPEGYAMYITQPTYNTMEIKANCYNLTDSGSVYCELMRDSIHSVIRLDERGNGCSDSICVMGSHYQRTKPNHPVEGLDEAVSKADLLNTINALHYSVMELQYNEGLMRQRMWKLEKLMYTTLESVGKIDDELIGQALGTNQRSKWFNHKIFNMCPCYKVNLTGLSNCGGGYMFQNGRITEQMDDAPCSQYSEGAITSLKIIDGEEMTFSSLQDPPLRGTVEDWDGWTWLAEKKQSLVDSALLYKGISESGSNSTLGYLYRTSVSSFHLLNGFNLTSGFISWVALILSLYAVIRR
nr:hemagglutinin protein [Red mite quaranjavirus]